MHFLDLYTKTVATYERDNKANVDRAAIYSDSFDDDLHFVIYENPNYLVKYVPNEEDTVIVGHPPVEDGEVAALLEALTLFMTGVRVNLGVEVSL